MTKEMIISSSAHETRVAILEDDHVAEIFIERERQRGVVGNLYKGRVSKVLPGMQSAFVDLGLERDGFLYVTDAIPSSEEFERFETFRAVPLEKLVTMKLVAYRLKDKVHLMDMLQLGMINASWPARFHPVLAARLQELIDHPEEDLFA